MAEAKPTSMNQATWDYLLKFTLAHEALIPHMYNNRAAEDQKQDVTCGIGFLLVSPEAAVSGYKDMFFDPATTIAATDDQIKADWKTASEILRKGVSVAEYAQKCKLRMHTDKVTDKMAQILKAKLASTLAAHTEISSRFAEFPAQAQVACASLFYGYALSKMPNFKGCLAIGDFCGAAGESKLNGASARKNNAHKILLENACRIVEGELDFDTLPTKFDPPEIIQLPGE